MFCAFQSQGCDYSLVRNFLMAIYSRYFTSKLTILFLPLFVVVFNDHPKMTTFWKPSSQYYNKWWNCFIFHKICAQKTQQRHEWIISLLLFTTLILSSIWFVFFNCSNRLTRFISPLTQQYWHGAFLHLKLVFKEYPQKSQIWKSETSPNQGTWLGIVWLGLVSLCQIWDFCGYSLNTLKYPILGICYLFPVDRGRKKLLKQLILSYLCQIPIN